MLPQHAEERHGLAGSGPAYAGLPAGKQAGLGFNLTSSADRFPGLTCPIACRGVLRHTYQACHLAGGQANQHAPDTAIHAPVSLQGLLLRILRGSEDVGVGRHSEEAGAERREQRRKRRLSSSAQAAALCAASQETDSSMSLPGADFGAACCWRDTASSCTSSDESEDTQP